MPVRLPGLRRTGTDQTGLFNMSTAHAVDVILPITRKRLLGRVVRRIVCSTHRTFKYKRNVSIGSKALLHVDWSGALILS